MFTTEQFKRSTLHEIISHPCLEKTRHARILRYVNAPVESTEISTPCQKLTSILIFLVGYILSEYWCALVWSRAMQYTPACNIPTVPNSCDKYILSSEHFNRLYSQTDWHDYQGQRSALIDIFYIPRSQNSYANILRPLKKFLSAIGLTIKISCSKRTVHRQWLVLCFWKTQAETLKM